MGGDTIKSAIYLLPAVVVGAALGSPASPIHAADLGGDCCADLEERLAELEATTARKGNRVVSLTLSGHVNKALMIWDDGYESNVYVADPDIGSSRFRFDGSAKIDADVSAGFYIEISIADSLSSDLTATDDDAAGNNKILTTRQVYWWVASERLGKLSVGQQAQAGDGISDVQLANTVTVVSDTWNSSFALSPGLSIGAGPYSTLTWGSIEPVIEGGRSDFVRYDSPSLHGFILSATWGEDDEWDVTLRYTKEWNSIKVAAAIGYIESSDGTSNTISCTSTATAAANGFSSRDTNCNLWSGSFSLLHAPSGLFVSFAGGEYEDNGLSAIISSNIGADYAADSGTDYVYVSGGIQRNWWSYGTTTFFGEGMNSGRGSVCVGANCLLPADDPLNASGADAVVKSADYSFWGLGFVQNIDAAAMTMYVLFRTFETDLDLTDVSGEGVDARSVEDMSVVFAGARIKF